MIRVVLLELDLTRAPSGTVVRLTNSPYDIIWNGYTFQATGDLLEIDGLDSTADLTTIGTTITLQGIDPSFQSVIDANGFLKAPIDLLLATIPDNTNIATEASYWHRGFCDTPATIVNYDDGSITIGIETQSIFQDLDREPNLMRTSQANHQANHKGDRFFEYVADTPIEEIWRT